MRNKRSKHSGNEGKRVGGIGYERDEHSGTWEWSMLRISWLTTDYSLIDWGGGFTEVSRVPSGRRRERHL